MLSKWIWCGVRRLRPLAFAAFGMATLAPFAYAASPASGPTVLLSAKSVTVTGITPGADVVFFGAGLEPDGFTSVLSRWCRIIRDDDKDGVVTYVPKDAIPAKFILAVADARNGQFTIASPEGFSVRRPSRARSYLSNGSGPVDRIASPGPSADAIYIHPGGGIWNVRLLDGSPEDADHQPNGVTVLTLADFKPLGGSSGEKPSSFVPGGTLLVIDFEEFTIDAVHLDGSVLNGGH